eukprot:g6394.t1
MMIVSAVLLCLPISTATATSTGASCGLERIEGHVYGTSHFAEPAVADADSCCAACAAEPKCVAYTYEAKGGTEPDTCFLKDNAADGGAKAGRTSGRRAPAAPTPAPPAQCTLQRGVEFLGNDVAAPAPADDEGACCAACAADAECRFYTYEGGSGGLCHHKNTDAPDYSRRNASCTSGFPGSTPPAPPAPARATVTVAGSPAPRSRTGPNFVCWNIDASENRGFFWRNLSATDPKSYGAQLARQAAALGEAQEAGYSLLRFGGSGNDYLTYAFNGTQCPPPTEYTQCLNETQWRDLLSFTAASGARMIFA